MHLGDRGVLTLKREKIVQVPDRRPASSQKEAPAGLSASTTGGSMVHAAWVSAAAGAPAAHGDGCRPAGLGSTPQETLWERPSPPLSPPLPPPPSFPLLMVMRDRDRL